MDTLKNLRDLGNTVIVVEHDEEAIMSADYVIDIGHGAGVHGGKIIATGTPAEILKNKDSLTAQYLYKKKNISVKNISKTTHNFIRIRGAAGNNLKNINADIPTGLFTCITGVSGSGKSTLINDTLYLAMANQLNRSSHETAPYEEIIGFNLFDKVIDVTKAQLEELLDLIQLPIPVFLLQLEIYSQNYPKANREAMVQVDFLLMSKAVVARLVRVMVSLK